MSILITGAKGQLGIDVVDELSNQFDEVRGFCRNSWDVTNDEQCTEILTKYKPKALIHCAAYTQVDQSEEDKERAYSVNVKATRSIAQICSKMRIKMVYISTDYVFNGSQESGYTEDDAPHPINVYGRTKRLGEKWVQRLCPNHMILRTSWLYGVHGKNFVYAILNRATTSQSLEVVHDQIGSPTYTGHLAIQIGNLLKRNANGLFHVANKGSCSWHEFAKEILNCSGYKLSVKPISSNELFSRKARRPTHSILKSVRLSEWGIASMPHWKDGLIAFNHKKGARKSND